MTHVYQMFVFYMYMFYKLMISPLLLKKNNCEIVTETHCTFLKCTQPPNYSTIYLPTYTCI